MFGGTGKGRIEYQKSVTWCLVSRDNRREWSYGAAMVTLPAAPTEPLASAALSFALAGVFRGRFCEILLRDRVPASFEEDAVVVDQNHSRLLAAGQTSQAGGQVGNDTTAGTVQKLGFTRTQKLGPYP